MVATDRNAGAGHYGTIGTFIIKEGTRTKLRSQALDLGLDRGSLGIEGAGGRLPKPPSPFTIKRRG